MPQTTYLLLTTRGAQKIAAALASETPIDLTHIAIGDGTTVPSGAETALYHEVARKTISGQGIVTGALNTLYADIYLAAGDGPYQIREMGLFDSAGELLAIGRVDPLINKPVPSSGQIVEGLLRGQLAVSNASAITIVVDPSMTVALQRLSVTPFIPVLSVATTAPPVSPALGDTYAIPAGATGSWAGQAQKLAEFTAAGWAIITPRNGHVVGLNDGRLFQRRGGIYVDMAATIPEAKAGLLTNKYVTPAGLTQTVEDKVKFRQVGEVEGSLGSDYSTTSSAITTAFQITGITVPAEATHYTIEADADLRFTNNGTTQNGIGGSLHLAHGLNGGALTILRSQFVEMASSTNSDERLATLGRIATTKTAKGATATLAVALRVNTADFELMTVKAGARIVVRFFAITP